MEVYKLLHSDFTTNPVLRNEKERIGFTGPGTPQKTLYLEHVRNKKFSEIVGNVITIVERKSETGKKVFSTGKNFFETQDEHYETLHRTSEIHKIIPGRHQNFSEVREISSARGISLSKGHEILSGGRCGKSEDRCGNSEGNENISETLEKFPETHEIKPDMRKKMSDTDKNKSEGLKNISETHDYFLEIFKV
jgi:hypothetical protein